MLKKSKLSIVILSYNTKDLLVDCLRSLIKIKDEFPFEIIIVDNGSTDGSSELIKSKFPEVRLIQNRDNLGFAGGNNCARRICRGEYVLFLNSDTVVARGVIAKTVAFLKNNPSVGAVSCKLILPDGSLDKDVRRAFPTPWVALSHLILRLDRIFPKSRLFARYWFGFQPLDEVQEVDVIEGAFFLTKKEILDRVDWFDEDYFLDGEDIDLCWKIKKLGLKIIYYPKVKIVHYKGASKGKTGQFRGRVGFLERLKFRSAGVASMELFYRKHLWEKYSLPVNMVVLVGIKLMKIVRFIQNFA